MQGLAGRSWAPLGLLLVCLSLPGLFARSIGAPEEKISPHSGKPSFTSVFKLGTAGVEQPQPKPDPENNELPRALPRLPESPPDGALPEESSEEPSQPFFWEGSPMESWLYEDPQPGMEVADEDHFEQVLPEAVPYLPYLSRGSPGPVASSASEASDPEDLEPDSSPLRTEADAFAQHPFWFFIHRLLPGFPWRILSPSVSWGGGGAGTAWGRRPMPYPSGIWGSNGQLSGTNFVGNGRYPVGSWGGNGRYPVGSWGGNAWNPAGSWGGNAWNPAGSWGGNGWNQLPPGVRPPRPNRLPPGVRPPRPNRLPPGVRPPRPNRLPPRVRPRPNRLPPGVRPPGPSGNIPNLSFQ
ncbi:2300002M23Rik [Phodopus roborovskii]|uniref:2300002M23Rik protein n=2 Tax=Phodopus roborovskii TaxID=109678 RepID=A0AAU9ZDM1_PHORO|nr:2300002M23Rik [Phodopus roborovskii]